MHRFARATLVFSMLLVPAAAVTAQDALDLLITGGHVYDGRGGPAREAAVGIRGDRIVFVGAVPAGATAKRRIDARGKVVTPGFIDPHTHVYEGLPRLSVERRRNLPSIMQGITTVVLGADGRGPSDVKQVLDASQAAGLG
ncbi:MAG: amidohydrolase family protein, partial [Gemmatimonas sp.]